MAQTKASHGGSMNDSMPGRRMRGEGAFAENIKRMFTLMRKRYFKEAAMPTLERGLFKPPPAGQLDLFG